MGTLKLIGAGTCLDAGDYHTPSFQGCRGGRTQRWKADEKAGWVKVLHAWEDNGRRRYFERCLDSKLASTVIISVQPCATAVERGVRWTRISSREPVEARLWRKAVKPSPTDPIM